MLPIVLSALLGAAPMPICFSSSGLPAEAAARAKFALNRRWPALDDLSEVARFLADKDAVLHPRKHPLPHGFPAALAGDYRRAAKTCRAADPSTADGCFTTLRYSIWQRFVQAQGCHLVIELYGSVKDEDAEVFALAWPPQRGEARVVDEFVPKAQLVQTAASAADRVLQGKGQHFPFASKIELPTRRDALTGAPVPGWPAVPLPEGCRSLPARLSLKPDGDFARAVQAQWKATALQAPKAAGAMACEIQAITTAIDDHHLPSVNAELELRCGEMRAKAAEVGFDPEAARRDASRKTLTQLLAKLCH